MIRFPVRQVSPTESRRRLRELMAGPEPLELPGPYDPACAQLLETIGFKALWAGGYMGSVTRLGAPDANVMTMTEQLAFATSLVEATDLPVVADIDHGYGEALMVTRTVQLFEKTGVSAVVIEDQGSPKHCAFYSNMPLNLISKEEFAAKIGAAVDARHDEAMMIWGRSDALVAFKSVDAALERANAAVDAGADAIFTPSASLDELKALADGWDRPQPLCMSSFNFPELTLNDVQKMGFSLRLHPLSAILAALAAVKNVYTELYNTGSFGSATATSLPAAEFEELIGTADIEALDNLYHVRSNSASNASAESK